MVLLCRQTGVPKAIILDGGYLTDIRTALAGVIVARYLAPHHISKIGILGTGVQARLQLKFLKDFTSCKDVVIWGRDLKRLALYKAEMQPKGFNIQTTQNITDVTSMCNFIITTTASKIPLLMAAQIQPGTHITAVGADGGGKQELEAELFQKATICVVDSLPQCADFGDTSYALKNSLIKSNKLIELGKVIQNPTHQRTHDQQITIADLTGVAVQDIEIANQVYRDRRLLV
jgi:ornithine cyclodeaminase